MKTTIHENIDLMGQAAANEAAQSIRQSIQERGAARIILATGSSQFTTLKYLVAMDGIDWSQVSIFHLDEYIGISAEHPASFRAYLRERVVNQLPVLKAFYPVAGDAMDLDTSLAELSKAFLAGPIDVACVGIGENGHLAFNDPPADFETQEVYLRVQLDEACRQQQVNEGWFPCLDKTPTEAVSMSIYHIMRSAHIVVSVPDARKAVAVQAAVQGPVTPTVPASILQRHQNCSLHLDTTAAEEL
jgi:glucosamine-6-phosphate deaminase